MFVRRDQAQLAAACLHLSIKQHQQAQPRAVRILHARQIEHQLPRAVLGDAVDLRFNLVGIMPSVMRPVIWTTVVVASIRSIAASRFIMRLLSLAANAAGISQISSWTVHALLAPQGRKTWGVRVGDIECPSCFVSATALGREDTRTQFDGAHPSAELENVRLGRVGDRSAKIILGWKRDCRTQTSLDPPRFVNSPVWCWD